MLQILTWRNGKPSEYVLYYIKCCLKQFTFRKKIFENYSEINLSEIIKTGEDAISNIAETAEKVIEDAVEKLNIIAAKNDSRNPSYDEDYYLFSET